MKLQLSLQCLQNIITYVKMAAYYHLSKKIEGWRIDRPQAIAALGPSL